MSRQVFAHLPRFDDAPSFVEAVRENEDSRSLPLEVVNPDPMAEPVAAAPPKPETGPDLLDAALEALARAADGFRDDARLQISASIKALAGSLFPKLSDAFLADEIAHQLDEILPAHLRTVEVRASSDLCGALEQSASRLGLGPPRLQFVDDHRLPKGQVRINWRAGGLEFDAGRLIRASAAALNADNPVSEDKRI